MTFEARNQRKLRDILFRNILANRHPKTLRTKRELMHIFIRCVAKPNYGNEEILKRLSITFLGEKEFKKLIENGDLEPYDFNEKET